MLTKHPSRCKRRSPERPWSTVQRREPTSRCFGAALPTSLPSWRALCWPPPRCLCTWDFPGRGHAGSYIEIQCNRQKLFSSLHQDLHWRKLQREFKVCTKNWNSVAWLRCSNLVDGWQADEQIRKQHWGTPREQVATNIKCGINHTGTECRRDSARGFKKTKHTESIHEVNH